MKSIIVDLDNTLSDDRIRQHFISPAAQDKAMNFGGPQAVSDCWDTFHANCGLDQPNMDVLELLDALSLLKPQRYGIIIVTARPERYRSQTMDWLKRYLVGYDALIMKGDFDMRGSDEWKLNVLEEWMGTRADVLSKVAFCLEDRDKVVSAFRAYGLPCWQVRKGAY